jgi:type I restriction enzyme R subunit
VRANDGEQQVIITTMQKFPCIATDSSAKHWSAMHGRIAIIADEAHRSHGKGTSSSIHEALWGQLKQIPNVTYFCFTATPSPSSLQLFGRLRQIPDGRLVHAPAHCYSMKQAVAEGCILNVLKNYTTLRPVVNLHVSSADKTYLTRSSAMSCVLEAASKRQEVLVSGLQV